MPPNTAGVSASPAAAVVAMQAPIQVQEMPQTAQQRNEAISRKVSLFRKSYGAQEVARLKQTLQMQSRVRREQAHLYEVTSTGKRKPAIPRPPEPPEMEQNRFTH